MSSQLTDVACPACAKFGRKTLRGEPFYLLLMDWESERLLICPSPDCKYEQEVSGAATVDSVQEAGETPTDAEICAMDSHLREICS